LSITAKDPKGPDGIRAVDTNYQCTADGVVCAHWQNARLNGCFYIVVSVGRLGEKRRAMTREELDRPIIKWTTAEVLKWRRTRFNYGTFASKWRVHTWEEMVKAARILGVTICPELKSTEFATDPNRARYMKFIADKYHYTCYPMTLVTMRMWQGKMKNFHDAGFETALLAHGAPRPTDLAFNRKYISAIWGSFA
jgi:hypothetical protein